MNISYFFFVDAIKVYLNEKGDLYVAPVSVARSSLFTYVDGLVNETSLTINIFVESKLFLF